MGSGRWLLRYEFVWRELESSNFDCVQTIELWNDEHARLYCLLVHKRFNSYGNWSGCQRCACVRFAVRYWMQYQRSGNDLDYKRIEKRYVVAFTCSRCV